MRILVHTIFYRPELTGVAKYTTELCEWLADRGHEVHVVAPPPYYPQWRVQLPYRARRYSSEQLGGVRVWRCPIWLPSGRPSGLPRVLYALSFALSSFPTMLSQALRRPDAVIVIEPSLLNLPGSWIAARIARATAWLHVQDFELDLAYDLGQLRRGRSTAERIEGCLVRRFDVVSSITARMRVKAARKDVPESRLFLFPNWFDPKIIFPLKRRSRMREDLGIPDDRVVALFAGSLGFKQAVELVIDAARQLAADPRILFVISGEGVASSDLRERAIGVANIRFLPLQSSEQLNELLNLADIHLLPQNASAAPSVMPSKLIGMLASGRPVVAAAHPGTEIAELIEGCGVAVAPGEPLKLAAAVQDLARLPKDRILLGERARFRAMDRFCRDTILAAFERELQRRTTAVKHRTAESLAIE
jgi:colanic acid biosynthesis glycosyl transferase WcaI